MSTTGYCLIDGNNVGFAAQSANRLSVGGQDTQAIYGVLRTIRQIAMTHAMLTPIVLWDGVTWRKSVYADYKANREKEATSAHDHQVKAMRASYRSQRPHITRGLRHLAVPQMIAMNLEADDLAGMLVKKARADKKKVILISGDKDWLQLVGPGVSWHDPIRDKRVNLGNFQEQTGYANPRQFLEGKALQGDASDNIPGVGGIGEKGAQAILAKWGSVTALMNMWIENELRDEKLPAKLVNFLNHDGPGPAAFVRNLRLMDLSGAHMPKPYGLKLDKGSFDKDAFAELCGEFAFKSILTDFNTWIEPFDPALKEAA